ncbi:hypothetical protein G6F40_018178 [Rhizopus arrhizus]|nr:hypothetical protein G6F40_018178 [Rhizopus arrhizus]
MISTRMTSISGTRSICGSSWDRSLPIRNDQAFAVAALDERTAAAGFITPGRPSSVSSNALASCSISTT